VNIRLCKEKQQKVVNQACQEFQACTCAAACYVSPGARIHNFSDQCCLLDMANEVNLTIAKDWPLFTS
jgi:hypothetical protein